MDGAELEIVCFCGGSENFERVIVQRKPYAPIVTDFVACVACRAMYFAPKPATTLDQPMSRRPEPTPKALPNDPTGGAIGGPGPAAG